MTTSGGVPTRARRIRHRVALVGCGVLAGLLAAELVCRLAAGTAGAEVPPPARTRELLRFSDDPYQGWELRPGHLDHNSAGFRGRLVAEARTPGVTRIATVGDSVTYGIGVAAHETFSAVLETELDERFPGAFEVLNFGVPGYSTQQVYRLLVDRLPRYAPDVVVVTLSPDDVETSPVVIDIAGEPCLFANQLEGLWPFNSRWHWRLFRRSALYRVLYEGMALALVHSAVPGEAVFVDPEVAWSNVERIRALVAAHGARLLLVLSPPILPVYGPGGQPIDTPAVIAEPLAVIRQRALASDASVLDLEPVFARYAGRLKLSPHDHEHFNTLGHRLVAAALAQRICQASPPA